MTADLSQAVHRLRSLSAEMVGVPDAERESRVKNEVQAVLKSVENDDRDEFLDGLLEAFPVWPPDIEPPPPPAPPTDEEMVQQLATKAAASEAERQRIAGLLRKAGIGGGMSDPQAAELRRFFNLPATVQPDLNRLIEVLRVLAKLVDDVEKACKQFLNANGVVFPIGANQRIADTIARLLPMADNEAARHARNADLENARTPLLYAVHVLGRLCPKYAEDLAEQYSPSNIEAAVAGMSMTRAGRSWEEYVRRLGGQRDRGGVKAEFESHMSRIIQKLVREI